MKYLINSLLFASAAFALVSCGEKKYDWKVVYTQKVSGRGMVLESQQVGIMMQKTEEEMRDFARESELSFRAGFPEADEAVQTVDYFKVDDIKTVEIGETYHKATLDGVDMDSYSDL